MRPVRMVWGSERRLRHGTPEIYRPIVYAWAGGFDCAGHTRGRIAPELSGERAGYDRRLRTSVPSSGSSDSVVQMTHNNLNH